MSDAVTYSVECRDCESVDRVREGLTRAENEAELHAAEHNGHRVEVWREHWPDGGRDYLGRVTQFTLKGRPRWS